MITLSLIAAVPIAGMAATIAFQEFQGIARGAQERAALLDGQALTQYHTAVATITRSLAADIARSSEGHCDPALASVLAMQEITGLLSVNSNGETVCQIGQMPAATSDASSGPRRWFEMVRGGAPFSLDAVGPSRTPVIAIPGLSGDVVAAVLEPSWFASHALPDPSGVSDVTWLLNEQRMALASRGEAQDAVPDMATMVGLISSEQIALRAKSNHGVRYAYATTLLPGGWRLIAATPAVREYEAAVHGLLFRMAELAFLLMLGILAVVFGADVAFGNPLRRLSAAVRRWQDGGPFEPGNLAGAPDEVLELAHSFQEATSVLRLKQAELERAREKQDLLVLEIHHRVKNNLQVIASLLNLQGSRIRVPEARAEFQAARDRVRALATLHRHLYADGELHTINMRSFLTELCVQLFQAMGEREDDRIHLVIEAPELRMSSDQAVPLALIVTEAVTNSVKYAFPGGRSGTVSVSLLQIDGGLDLVISDDGIGIPAGIVETESGTRDGIGLRLIRGFSRQLGATLEVDQGGGTRYAVRLHPQTDPLPARLDA